MVLRYTFTFLLLNFSISLFAQINQGGFKLEDEPETTSILPDVLLSFDAVCDSNRVELTWSSNTELNNNFYVVEKSKDALNFEALTTVKSFGNHSNIISYFEADFTPYEGVSYYRLTQINEKGNVLSSRVLKVNTNQQSQPLYQNLAINTTSNIVENKEILVVLRSEKGEESFSKIKYDTNRNIIQSDDSHKLDAGAYTIIASSDNKLFSQKLYVR